MAIYSPRRTPDLLELLLARGLALAEAMALLIRLAGLSTKVSP